MAIKEKETYYRIYYIGDGGYTHYTDSYGRDEALERYAIYIERYSKVALVKIVENRKIILGSLGD